VTHDGLTREEVRETLEELEESVRRDECLTCECYQGFLTQLALDAAADARPQIEELRVPREEVHECLGCDPCGPGSAFADYVRACRAQSRGEAT